MLAVPKRDIIGHHSVGPLDRKLKKKESEKTTLTSLDFVALSETRWKLVSAPKKRRSFLTACRVMFCADVL